MSGRLACRPASQQMHVVPAECARSEQNHARLLIRPYMTKKMRVQSMKACNQVRRSSALGTSACRHRKLPNLPSHRAKTVSTAVDVEAEKLATRVDGIWSFSEACEPNEALVTVPREAWLTADLVDSSPIGSETTGVMSSLASSLWWSNSCSLHSNCHLHH